LRHRIRRQRVKTKVQRLREYKRLNEIEAALAKEREREGGQKKGRTNLSDPGRARTKAAAMVGLSENTAEKGLAVLNKAESGDPQAV
jgi:hypothetical protein